MPWAKEFVVVSCLYVGLRDGSCTCSTAPPRGCACPHSVRSRFAVLCNAMHFCSASRTVGRQSCWCGDSCAGILLRSFNLKFVRSSSYTNTHTRARTHTHTQTHIGPETGAWPRNIASAGRPEFHWNSSLPGKGRKEKGGALRPWQR